MRRWLELELSSCLLLASCLAVLPSSQSYSIITMNARTLSWISLALWPALHNAVSSASPLGSTVLLADGAIFGNERDSSGILSFKGIPYATPPVGALRWTPPQPPAPWIGTLNATQFGFSCWSNIAGLGVVGSATPNNEDCLTMNVWTGATDSSEKRPVMFWIYGGGFQFGSSGDPTYNGTTMAGEGVIVVNFNYRLGVFGFLGLDELDKEGIPSGDYGLQDMLLALRWVKSNIAAFGGDPDSVTIFGESAGAHAIGLLMSSPIAKKEQLFHKAIMESGAWWDRSHGPLTTYDEARQYGANFKKKLNVTSVAELRAISAQDINNAQPFSLNHDPGVTNFSPSVDGYVIPVVPGRAFHNGLQMKIPLLAGFNSNEQYVFQGNELPHNTSKEFESAAEILFGDRMPEFLSLYPDNISAFLNASSGTLIGDLYIREQTWEAAYTHRKTTNMPVFAYYYTYASMYEPIPSHTAEMPFVFGNFVNNPVIDSVVPPDPQDMKFSKEVMGYWVNFAKNGNPNSASSATWPEYGTGGADYMELGVVLQPYQPQFLAQYHFIASFRDDGVLPLSWRNLSSVGV